MDETEAVKTLQGFVENPNEISNLDDAKKYIRVLTLSNNSLAMLASECVAHLAADESGVIRHSHNEDCPVTIMLGIMEELGVCYKSAPGVWQVRKTTDRLN